MRVIARSRIVVALVGVAVVAVALPQITILHAEEVVPSLFQPDDVCTANPSISDPGFYYDCIEHWAWGKHMVVLDALRSLDERWEAIMAAVFSLAWIALLLAIADRSPVVPRPLRSLLRCRGRPRRC